MKCITAEMNIFTSELGLLVSGPWVGYLYIMTMLSVILIPLFCF